MTQSNFQIAIWKCVQCGFILGCFEKHEFI